MQSQRHPAAIEHLPAFVTAPGETDVLFVVCTIFVLLTVMSLGILYFRLHALPEQMAHRGHKVQFQIVAVLGLVSLFTHNHAFWIAGLLLALISLPDFTTPVTSMAHSLRRLANMSDPEGAASAPPPMAPPRADHAHAAHATNAAQAAGSTHTTDAAPTAPREG
jgi:hypothetical protein